MPVLIAVYGIINAVMMLVNFYLMIKDAIKNDSYNDVIPVLWTVANTLGILFVISYFEKIGNTFIVISIFTVSLIFWAWGMFYGITKKKK